MNKKASIRRMLALALLVAGLLSLGLGLFTGGKGGRLESTSRDLGRQVERRLYLLESYIDKARETPSGQWMELEGLPADMVIYRYVADTLQSWHNQFPVRNDDIRPRTLLQRLGDSRSSLVSPLAEIGEDFTFVNQGPKWFLEKAVESDGCKIIAGLEIKNELRAGSMNGVNPRLHLEDRYHILPLSSSSGVPVMIQGQPLFMLSADTLVQPGQRHTNLLWLAVALLLAASLVLLRVYPGALPFGFIALSQMGLLLWLYSYGRALGAASPLFSPMIYADGPVLYSLGAVILVNLAINVLVLDLYLVHRTVLMALCRRESKFRQVLVAAGIVLLLSAVAVYLHFTLRSVVVNSNITLELYRIRLLSVYSALVYLSFLALSLAIPLLLQTLSPLLRSLVGIRYNMFSTPGRVLYALAVGIYLVATTSTLGLEKEQRRVGVWANRLAMDRDIGLEIQLRGTEAAMASDGMIGALSMLDGSEALILNRITTTYMSRIAQDYDIGVVLKGEEFEPLLERLRSGVRLGGNSHFFYSSLSGGRTAYTGLFTYYVPNTGSRSVLITVESKHNREDRGYLRLLGVSDPGQVSLPPVYSRAKYANDRLVQYKGAYPFATVLAPQLQEHCGGYTEWEGYTHFVNEVSDSEVIVISRPTTEWLYYVVEGFLVAIIAFGAISGLSRRRRRSSSRRYYQTRIGLVIYISLTITLVAMAGFSVWFVYKRNNAEMESTMTSRTNVIQSMLQEQLRGIERPEDLGTAAVLQRVEAVGNNLKCDLTLFDVAGRVLMSTTPEVYERMILGKRLNHNAFQQINFQHKRIFIQREQVGRRAYYALYAPILNSNGSMVGIFSSPYTESTGDLETEAILHIATVITLFLLLLMFARLITFEVVDRMFRPIAEIRRKMTVTDVDQLEPIIYEQDDELTPLVQAYNRMVKDLGESSRRLTQVERDKAWTDMARRVAHDLKNPLTPIKLQLQMLMRQKATGNPAWQERFDEVAQTVLYHVDLLADSADQFSTFAKMYDQSPERLDLNALLQQEVDLFDAREDIRIDYFGLSDSWVMAPRPQLTRVVVNLITNAIQAVDGNSGEKRLVVSLRNASEDGFYEFVVEDNGPGVDQELQSKIFTPDFTTKTSGSGLGLAICRRIVDHCGGSISYNRSFTLGGACFTVKYPKEGQ